MCHRYDKHREAILRGGDNSIDYIIQCILSRTYKFVVLKCS